MKEDTRIYLSFIGASLMAVLVLLFADLSYRSIALRLLCPTTSRPLDVSQLALLPLRIGGWEGEDIPLSKRVIEVARIDSCINRIYSLAGKGASISLYIGAGGAVRDIVSHRPEVCYTMAGWTLMNREYIELLCDDGIELECSVMRFSRGDLELSNVTVLNYFVFNGELCGDVSQVLSAALHGGTYVGQVQIASAAGDLNVESATELVCAFACDSAPMVVRLFASIDNEYGQEE